LRSFDQGLRWEEPLRLNQDDTTRIQFFPSIDVSPDGIVHAMWGDMRDDPDEVRYHIYYSRSQDQGATWGFENAELGLNTPDTRVTDFPSNSLKGFPGGRFIGDYFSIAASEEDVYLVWADTRLGEFGGPNQQIGFARQQAIAPPSLFLNPPSGDAGRDVAIQGLGFQPDSNITIDVGGITVTNLRSNENGEFQTNIYMPVTGEGPRNVVAYDETGNVATSSFYTEFGFDSIARELEALTSAQGLERSPSGTPAAVPPAGATPVAVPPAGATPVADELP
ncbi:MAG: exo-alpha-sialidase, partial [Chloroflexia bacterium]|nr:exo-alpha-sialidase [Chloroflexia bacterium]